MAFNNRGLAYETKGEIDRAIRDFDQAIKINPNDATASTIAATPVRRASATTTAPSRTSIRRIKLNPSDALAYNERGSAYIGQARDRSRASPTSTQAIRLNPNYDVAFNNRGYAYRPKGDNDRAIADFDQAIKINPNVALAFHATAASPIRQARLRPRHRTT